MTESGLFNGLLGELGAEYERMAFSEELAMSQTKRLESMQAPWAAPPDSLVATQRAVVLYHLYEVERAEHKVLMSRIAARRESATQVLAAYRKLRTLLEDAGKNLEIVLGHLNQPESARIRALTTTFLNEVTAFRNQLQASENPRLREMAEDAARFEEAARKAREQADKALETILQPRGQ